MKKTVSNKGITLIALIITVILLLILLSVVTYMGIESYENSKVMKFVSQMQLLQSKIDELITAKTPEQLDSIKLQIGGQATDNYQSILTTAFNGGEISTNIKEKYYVFGKQHLLDLLDVEDTGDTILVNFETREIVSIKGVKYNGTQYYTQYKLPNGQKVFQGVPVTARDLEFNTTIDRDGLNCKIEISNVSIVNGTLSCSELDSSSNPVNWETITNYTENNKTYTINITKSGSYKIKLIDNTNNTSDSSEQTVNITLTNKPKTNQILEPYNYNGDSTHWAYAQKNTTWYVWIPRFAYKINTSDNTIETRFIKGNSNIATDDTYIDNTWEIHTKFEKADGNKLTGIWVNSSKQPGLNMLELLNNATEFLEQI